MDLDIRRPLSQLHTDLVFLGNLSYIRPKNIQYFATQNKIFLKTRVLYNE